MTRTGIDDPFRPGDDPDPRPVPEPIDEWVKAGIPADEAETWRNWRYRISEATAWRQAGVLGGIRAAQWTMAGANPRSVHFWRAAGIDATEAVAWREFAFSLEEAKQHKASGMTPIEASQRFHSGLQASAALGPLPASLVARSLSGVRRSGPTGVQPQVWRNYMARPWVDDEAAAWAKEGIDPAEALLWKELGLLPAEAARLIKRGATVFQTVREWWQAGIPIDEVAEWIGAGLTSGEAADQRARGISAEQAATLRALRDGDDE
jgi:hypothetical protein